MALWATVENGTVVDTSASATSASSTKSTNDLDKDDFLNLLVAQMKYQDPLEPESNTEYVSQLATFTQVESLENMSNTMESLEADSLVGQTVIMRPTNSVTGETSEVQGVVDYVLKEGSNIYLSVNGSLYNYDDLYTVADTDYINAVAIADDFESTIAELPDADHVSLSYESAFAAIRQEYDNLTTYQKEYISTNCSDSLNKFLEAETALNALITLRDTIAATGSANGSTTDDTSDDTETAADTSAAASTVTDAAQETTEDTTDDTTEETVAETVEASE
jgi:flagellar basal-body rod modification protein FlgD